MRGSLSGTKWMFWGMVATCGLSLMACKGRDRPSGVAATQAVSLSPEVCKQANGELEDSISAAFFTRVVGGYCIDPNGETLAYGEAASLPLDEVCTRLFDRDCEVYKGYGLVRVVTRRYIDAGGSPGSVRVDLLTFATDEGAYGFFTERVISDTDPQKIALRPFAAGAAAALGNGIAKVLHGSYVAELAYVNELETPAQANASGATILPPIAVALAAKLPGSGRLPDAAALLPQTDLLPLGVSYQVRDALGVKGAGAAAMGYYKRGKQRWRVLSIERSDLESAKDIASTFAKTPGYSKIKDAPFDAFRLIRRAADDGPKIEWIIARDNDWVWGVGDEEHVLDGELSDAELTERKLDLQAKQKVLKELIGISSQRSRSAQH